MSLVWNPHSYTILLRVNAKTGGTVTGFQFEEGPTYKGMIQPEKMKSVMYERWGIELDRPHTLFAEPEHASLLKVNDRIRYGTREFSIEADPKLYDMEMTTSHCCVPLEEITHVLSS